MKKSDLVKYSLPISSITAKGQKLTIKTNSAYPELVSELANPFMAIYDTDAKSDVNQNLLVQALTKLKIISNLEKYHCRILRTIGKVNRNLIILL